MMKPNNENPNIAYLIYKQLIGTINTEENATLEQWRKAAPRNEEIYQHLTDIQFLSQEYRRMKTVNTQRPQQDMQARIRQEHRSSRQSRQRWATTLLAVASLAAVFCIGYFWHSPLKESINEPSIARQTALLQLQAGTTQATLTLSNGSQIALDGDITRNSPLIAQRQKHTALETEKERINKLTTPRGGEFKIVLEDSTVVWLNAESQLIYPEKFTANERKVSVKGEAYFKVAKDSLRPFYVESSGMRVKVYGTEFNINAYNEDKHIYTTLVSGKIALQPMNSSKAELVLTPGHQAVFLKSDRSTLVRSVDTQSITSWHEGRFAFEEQTLEQIMLTLARWYNFKYEFNDDKLALTVFKGSAPRYANLSEVLSILEKSGGIKFHVEGEKIIITTNNYKNEKL